MTIPTQTVLRMFLPASLGLALMTATAAVAAPHAIDAFIKEYDLNKDGSVSRAELVQERQARFKAMDTDANGTLSEAEYVSEYEGRLKAELASETDKIRRDEIYTRQMRQAHVRFGVMDSNKDKGMSFDEYFASGQRMFEAHDRDKDGTVSRKDFDLAKAAEQVRKDKDKAEVLESMSSAVKDPAPHTEDKPKP